MLAVCRPRLAWVSSALCVCGSPEPNLRSSLVADMLKLRALMLGMGAAVLLSLSGRCLG